MTTLILETLHRHLAELPLMDTHRAEIFHAWEAAPAEPIDSDQEGSFREYMDSPAGRAWFRVREYRLRHPESASAYATTLEECAFYESAPTQTEILKALARAVDKLNGAFR